YLGSETVFVAPNVMTRININMKKGLSSLRIYSKPFEAIVTIDDKEIGPTPQIIDDITAGPHKVKLSLPGYIDHEESINLNIGEEQRLDVRLFKESLLKIDTSPVGADIVLNGRYFGKAPIVLSSVKPGKNTITARIDGYFTWEKDIEFQEGENQTIEIEMKPDLKGLISFSSLPKGTSVYIDTMFIGVTPLEGRSFSVGEYSARLERYGCESGRRMKVTVDEYKTIRIKDNLKHKTKSRAILYTMIIPGTGQIYTGRKTPGWIYAAGELAALGYFALTISDYNGKIKTYDEAAIREDVISAYEDAESAQGRMFTAGGIAAGFYIWNVADVLLFSNFADNQENDSVGMRIIPGVSPDGNPLIGVAINF
ncbi:PEGA domain-containing protein, partial [Calditrichota bacterium]